MSYCEILVRGKNQAFLFERLKKHNIDIIKVKTVDENTIIIRVYKKDSEKVFAILGKTWYNKLIRLGGFYGFFSNVRKRIGFLIGAILFLLLSYFSKDIIFSVDVVGAKPKNEIYLEKNLSSFGIERFSNFNKLDINKIKESLLSDLDNVSFVTLEKSGNRLIIRLFESDNSAEINNLDSKSLISTTSGKLVRLNVYSGSAKKEVGDQVCIGEELISGKVSTDLGDYETKALGYALIESTFLYEKTFEDISYYDKASVIEEAKFNLPISEYDCIISYFIEENRLAKGIHILVKINYLVEIGG